MAERIGFIGLGQMGQAMAGNLLRAGYTLHVYNRTREKAAALAGQGATNVEITRSRAGSFIPRHPDVLFFMTGGRSIGGSSGAAARLGVKWTALQSTMRKLGIPRRP